ncbi:hypothetical protein K469DRAFT_637291 [Zopfia rhizophila CBS 207.26]|uniref:DUF4604 domain-containing protein n=1 Tax=Zopfia rhizophila CBS 207.26 TaxID=1314779 RepID=A0A6A6DU77_9PEZI|nr:hypothetical protein K469DRAFT_637291 [Zopfia rhizophila CBS 207.26]
MSFKAKDLSYDAKQPAFLQRLRGEAMGEDSVRHERPIPRNKRLKQDDEDDAPTYVLEDTNVSLSKAEYEALLAGKSTEAELGEKDGSAEEKDAKFSSAESNPKKANAQQFKSQIAEVGQAARKRKAVKVIGSEQEEDNATKDQDGKTKMKPKKKAKAVKLSFGDQEEG